MMNISLLWNHGSDHLHRNSSHLQLPPMTYTTGHKILSHLQLLPTANTTAHQFLSHPPTTTTRLILSLYPKYLVDFTESGNASMARNADFCMSTKLHKTITGKPRKLINSATPA